MQLAITAHPYPPSERRQYSVSFVEEASHFYQSAIADRPPISELGRHDGVFPEQACRNFLGMLLNVGVILIGIWCRWLVEVEPADGGGDNSCACGGSGGPDSTK